MPFGFIDFDFLADRIRYCLSLGRIWGYEAISGSTDGVLNAKAHGHTYTDRDARAITTISDF